MDHPPKQVKLDIRPERQAPAEQGQRQEQALDIFPNPVEGPDDLAPGPSSGPSSGPSPGPSKLLVWKRTWPFIASLWPRRKPM